MKTNQKLQVDIELLGQPKYSFDPEPVFKTQDGNKLILEYAKSSNDLMDFAIHARPKHGEAVIIKTIKLNGSKLTHLDSFGTYCTDSGVKYSYGYMDEPGQYKFRIRYNALTHELLNHLISQEGCRRR